MVLPPSPQKHITHQLFNWGTWNLTKEKGGWENRKERKSTFPTVERLGHEQKPNGSHKNRSLKDYTTCQGIRGPANLSSCGAFALWCCQGKGFKQANGDLRTAVLEGHFGEKTSLILILTLTLFLLTGKGSKRKS